MFDQDCNAWVEFCDPAECLVAEKPGEVAAVIRRAEEAAEQGMTAVGYLAYEAAGALDHALPVKTGLSYPLAMFGLFDTGRQVTGPAGAGGIKLEPVLDKPAYDHALEKIRHYLAEGDTYQVNFTHPLQGCWAESGSCSGRDSLEGLFASLYRAQPSPYAAMLETERFSVCSVSPELFFELDGSHLRTEPMKGTRPRGRYPAEDLAMQQALAASDKDRAENLMIVDMIRNDLGRIAEPGSVKPQEMFSLLAFPTVWQQVSSVSAVTNASILEIFAALFPCASVTGAPRRRTMEIIAELEAEPRGIYTGAIGLVRPGRKARFSVAIRTLVMEHETNKISYGVGGGIVWDSRTDDEWAESLLKATVLDRELPEFELLETMRFEPGSGVFLLEKHLARLAGSATYFGFTIDELAIREQLQALSFETPVRLRLLVSRSGGVALEAMPINTWDHVPRLRLAMQPVNSRDPFLFHKTTHRQVYESAMLPDCDDVVLFNEKGELTETTISNIYLELDGCLYTPPVHSGLLAGTYRETLLESGRVQEKVLKVEDLARATRIFLSNSVRDLCEASLAEDWKNGHLTSDSAENSQH